MAEETVCANCGKPLSAGVCPDCGAVSRLNLLPSLPLVGFVFVLVLLIGFSVTRFAVQTYKSKQKSIAASWQKRGEQDLRALKAEPAIEDFENALAYDRENSEYRLQLTMALVQAGRYDEAQSHLRSLWEERPGDSNVNLQLARLEVRRGNLREAERYYEGAIYGVWPAQQDPYQQRIQVRTEFAKLLIASRRFEEARGQLSALSAEVGPDGTARKVLGDLFMQTNSPKLAFTEYLRARERPKAAPKGYELELAKAAYAQNDFASANRWASVAMREDPKSAAAADFARQTALIMASDPFAAGIGELRRAERVISAFKTTDARMSDCFPTYTLGPHSRENVSPGTGTQLPQLPPAALNQVVNFSTWAEQLRPQMVASRLRHKDDVQENAMRFVFQAEQFAAKNCSLPASEDDKALVSLAKERWSNE